jgi:CheY-like chemotaxis protein
MGVPPLGRMRRFRRPKTRAPSISENLNPLSAPSRNLARFVSLMPLSAANDLAALVILLVEDEFMTRWSVAGSLRDAGYNVVETASGEEAIAICGTEVPIDLLFTDINLLGSKTGWDVADFFRTHRPKIAVLYTSGSRIDAIRQVYRSEFLAKPYQLSKVVSTCRRLCKT